MRTFLVGMIAVLMLSNALLVVRQCGIDEARRKARMLDAHCQRMVAAVVFDEVEMEGSSLRKEAAVRFANRFEGGADEIKMCTNEVPAREAIWGCVARDDYACLVRLARQLAAAMRSDH